ncbi:hypothetical protein L1987_32767 [Smallanthus sonchifolius]|uniref:Uncharacterized protein n=1 Tax=Smallanthus sonchifolius TaxID=185202 RepID=A0ACB9HQW3_9ASTR|nr:hypothetical protein L1987_32767 [Smallanthus sonchifolius]
MVAPPRTATTLRPSNLKSLVQNTSSSSFHLSLQTPPPLPLVTWPESPTSAANRSPPQHNHLHATKTAPPPPQHHHLIVAVAVTVNEHNTGTPWSHLCLRTKPSSATLCVVLSLYTATGEKEG